MHKSLIGASAFLVTLLLPWAAEAQTTFTPTQDTWVMSNDPDSATNWNQVYLDAEEFISTPLTELTYIQFDISTLPVGDIVSNAILRVWITRENGADAGDLWEVRPVDNAWADTTLTYTISQTFTFGAVAASMVPPDIGSPNDVIPAQSFDFDVTALVQAWHTGATVNNGIEMRIQPGGQADMRIGSMEGPAGEEAELIVTHAPPPPPPPPPAPPGTRENDNGLEDDCGCATIAAIDPRRTGLILLASLGLLFLVTRRR